MNRIWTLCSWGVYGTHRHSFVVEGYAGHGLSPFCIGLQFIKNTSLSKDIKKQIAFFHKTQGNNHWCTRLFFLCGTSKQEGVCSNEKVNLFLISFYYKPTNHPSVGLRDVELAPGNSWRAPKHWYLSGLHRLGKILQESRKIYS